MVDLVETQRNIIKRQVGLKEAELEYELAEKIEKRRQQNREYQRRAREKKTLANLAKKELALKVKEKENAEKLEDADKTSVEDAQLLEKMERLGILPKVNFKPLVIPK